MNNPTHIAFADETNHTADSGRFGAIALLTLPIEDKKILHNGLSQYQTENKIKEFKWQQIKDSRQKNCAKIFIDTVIDKVCRGNFRVDVLSWDYHDKRHKIPGRDDIANFHRMYHHLLKNVFTNKWPDNLRWKFYPDENSAVNWKDVEHFLGNKSISIELNKDLFKESGFNWRLLFHLLEIQELNSKTTPMVQIADLFAGMSTYSRESYAKYIEWERQNDPNPDLFDSNNVEINLSKNDNSRCEIIEYLKSSCDKHKLGVSLKSSKGLKTHSPRKPINFWWYEPQHEADIAPLKKDTNRKMKR